MILVTALSLASTAAYMSIVGLAELFAAHKYVVIIMAVFIEWAKLLFAGGLHMFWRTLPWWKWIAVGFVGVHMLVTNIGIYSYLSSGYLLQEAPVAAIEREIDIINGSITSHMTVEQEAVTRISSMDTAYQEYVENLYIRRAEKYKADNAELRSQLETQRDEARAVIAQLEAKRAELVEQKVESAAKLGSIDHIATYVSEDNALTAVALFTLLLMLGLDPAAIMMVILFTHLLSKVVRKPEPDGLNLTPAETKEVQRQKDVGFLKNRVKGREK